MTNASFENCHVQLLPAGNETGERKNTSPFCYAILAKIKWQTVIKVEENTLVMFVPSQAQLSFHLDNESFTHSQASFQFL